MKRAQGLTAKQIADITGVPFYIIQYLKKCNRLPLIKPSKGRGKPHLYDPKAVEVVLDHVDIDPNQSN